MEDATTKALLSFNKKHLQVGELNERKVIAVSIAVVGEEQHPSTGRKVGKSIEREMQMALLWSTGMANLIRLVTHKGVSYYENPSLAETKAFGDPGELIFDAKGNKQLTMHIEKVMQVYVLYRQLFTQEKIKRLQLTAGNGCLRQGSSYKVGVRFLLLKTIEELGFVFKDNLSNKQLLFPILPKGTILKNGDNDDNDNGNDDDSKDDSEDDVNAEDDDGVDVKDDDDGDTIDLTNESEDEDERVQKYAGW
jgi:hypothetical protein